MNVSLPQTYEEGIEFAATFCQRRGEVSAARALRATLVRGEVFSDAETMHAIDAFLEFGEESFCKKYEHKGYFSGQGWAARCLRAHLAKLRAANEKSET